MFNLLKFAMREATQNYVQYIDKKFIGPIMRLRTVILLWSPTLT